MKHLLTLILGLGVVSAASCSSPSSAEIKAPATLTLAVTGMT